MSVTDVVSRFPHLFQPLMIRGVTLPNRIGVSGHFAYWWVGEHGLPNDKFVAYVEERAKGGVGLFVIGATSPMPGSGWMENTSDAIIPRYARLAEAGHRHGTPIFAQLCHPGFGPLPPPNIIKYIPTAPRRDEPAVERRRKIPTIEELQILVQAFGAAAGRAAAGGVDGVELHAHESFLHAQMLNPIWNTRADEYGGPLENRLRFLVETLQAMRAAVPSEMPVGIRLKADDMEQRGMGPEEYAEALHRLESAGLIDYVNFTGGDARLHHGPTPRPDGEWIPLVRSLKATTRLPVMHAGRINTAEMAEDAIASGAIDLAIMTKSHICDPHFVLKVRENRLDDIRYCTRCLRCHGEMGSMACIYNPLTSREWKWSDLPPAIKRRRVVVIGAGPAGMETAITAAARGHDVIVLEKDAAVGGQTRIASSSPLRTTFGRVTEFYERQASKDDFEVRLNTPASPELLRELHPDVIVVATGSRPKRAEIPGAEGRVFTVHEAITAQIPEVNRVLLLDREGGPRPLVAADALSARGIQVEYATSMLTVGPKIDRMVADEFVDRLLPRAVRFYPGQDLIRREDVGVWLRDVQTGEETLLEGDYAIVAAVGSEPIVEIAPLIDSLAPEIHIIGDAREPGTCEGATLDGATVARAI